MPLLQALTDKMRWHQARQDAAGGKRRQCGDARTIAARDLKAFSLDASPAAALDGHRYDHRRFAAPDRNFELCRRGGGFGGAGCAGFEITPEGTRVSLEDEMMKVTSNELDYQTATTLYTRSLRLIRTALGRSAWGEAE